MSQRGKSVTITYTAWDATNNVPKTGDVANHTLRWVKDGTSAAPTNSPAEVDATNAKGVYKLVLTAAEASCDVGKLCGVSATAGVALFGPTIVFENAGVVVQGTAVSAAAGTLTLASGDGAKVFRGNTVFIQSATAGTGQARTIISISTDTVTLDIPWGTTPTGTITYVVFGTSQSAVYITISGTPSSTAFISDRTEATDNFWKDSYVEFVTGALAGQVKKCTAYAGATKTFTCNAFTAAPAAGDIAKVVNY